MEVADESGATEPERRAPRLRHTKTKDIMDTGLAQTQAELTAVDPERAEWLVAILAAYKKQEAVLAVRSHASNAAH